MRRETNINFKLWIRVILIIIMAAFFYQMSKEIDTYTQQVEEPLENPLAQ